jgi:hypothetical protein
MEILSYLTELVKTRKEVGIAGLGTIYKKKSPGRYDIQTHSFLPPAYTLEFTEDVKESNALAEFISKNKNISVDSSSYYVEQFAEGLLKQLEETGEADLDELGKLSISDNGVIFSPSGLADFGFEFYGLPSLKDDISLREESYATEQEAHFHERLDLEDHNADLSDGTSERDEQPVYDEISEIKHQGTPKPPVFIETTEDLEEEPANEQVISENENSNPDQKEAENQTIENNPDNRHPDTEEKADHYWNFDKAHSLNTDEPAEDLVESEITNKTGTPAYLKVIIALAILLVIAVGVYFIRPELFKAGTPKQQTKAPAINASQPGIDSAAKADSALNAARSATLTVDSLKDTTAVVKPVVPPDTTTTWEVIGASVVRQEVNQVVADMKRRGITGKVIPNMPGKRRIKISIATFYDEASARAGRKALVVKLKNPDLYIYQNKHTNTQIK